MKKSEFILELIKLIKPSFHNKITWFLVVFGTTLISTPLIEKVINAIFEKQFTISITENNDTHIGFWLIAIGLIYNILTNYFDKYLSHLQTIRKLDNNSSHDKILYEKFLQKLPSDGSIEFIKYHDFHNSFSMNDLKQLINFSNEWINAEHEFINLELEDTKKELLEKVQDFVYDSSRKTFPLRDDMQTIMNNVDKEKGLTENTKNNILLLNSYGDEIFVIHQKFVRKGRYILCI